MSQRQMTWGHRRRALTAITLVAAMITGAAITSLAPNAQPVLAAPGDGFELTIAGPTTLPLGESGLYTISVVNNDVDTTDVTLYLESYGQAINSIDSGDWTCTPQPRGYLCTRPALTAGATAPPITVELLPDTGQTAILYADVQSGDIVGYGDIEVSVVAPVDLALTAPTPRVNAGTYEADFVVTNVGSGGADYPGPVTVSFESSFSGATLSGSTNTAIAGVGWTCVVNVCTHPGPVPTGGALDPITVTGTQTDSVFIIAGFVGGDANDSNDTAYAYVPLAGADMSIRRNAPFSPAAGAPTSFTLDVSNVGTEATTTDLTVVITTSLEIPVAAGVGWTCTPFVAGSATCTRPSATYTPFSIVDAILVNGLVAATATRLTGSATITPSGSRSTNDVASFDVFVTPAAASLSIAATTAMTSLSPGAPFQAVATVTNTSATAPFAGPVQVAFPSSNVSAFGTGDGWTCSPTTRTCDHPGPVAASASLPPITYTGTVASYLYEAPLVFTLTPGGASARITLPIAVPDLAIVVTPTPSTVIENDPLQLDVAVSNVGAGDATGTVTVTISTPFAEPTIDANGWTCTSSYYLTCTYPGPTAASVSLPVFTISGIANDDYDGAVNSSAWVQLGGGYSDGNSANNSVQVAVPVTPLVDLALSGTAIGELSVGSTGTVDFTVVNRGVGTATSDVGVSISGNTLSDISVVGTNWSCSAYSTSAYCTYLGAAGPGETLPAIRYTGTVGPTNDGIVNLYGSTSHPNDRRSGNNYVRLADAVIAPIDLSVAVDSDATFTPGSTGSYIATVSNLGVSASTGSVVVQLFKDSGLDLVAASGSGWTCVQARCSTNDIVPGGGASAPITFTVNPRRTYSGTTWSTIRVSGGGDGRLDNNDVDAQTPFVAAVDATIALAPNTTPFVVGRRNAYAATVTNTATEPLTGPISVSVSLSSYFSEVEAVGDGWTCTAASYSARCEHPGPLAAASSLPVIEVSGVLSRPYSTTVSASASLTAAADQRSDNDYVYINTLFAGDSDLSIGLDGPTSVAYGDPIAITARVLNVLDKEAVGNIKVTLSGEGLTAPIGTGNGWTCTTPYSAVECTHPGPVPASGSLPDISIAATVGATSTGAIFASGWVEGATDTITTNNNDSISIDVVTGADLAVEVTDGDQTFNAGEPGDLTVTVTNVGTVATTLPVTVEARVSQATAATYSGDGWTCTVALPDITCSNPGLLDPADSLAPLTLTVTPPLRNTSMSTTVLVASTEDGVSGNNQVYEYTPVTTVVKLAVDVDDSGANFPAGGTGVYTVDVRNDGSAPSNGTVTVELTTFGPSTVIAATGDTWTCVVDTVTSCTTDAIAPAGGAWPTLDVTVQTNITGGATVGLQASTAGGGDVSGYSAYGSESTPLASPDLTVDVSDADATFVAPGTGTYTVTVGNAGAAPTIGIVGAAFGATGPISVTDIVGDGWTCTTATATCTRSDSIGVGATFPELTVTVAVAATTERSASLRATVTGFDASPANSTETEATPIVVASDLTVAVTPTTPWYVGQAGAATATVTNVGTAPATTTTTVMIPRATTASGDGWACVPDGTAQTCTTDNAIADGASLPDIAFTVLPTLNDLPSTELSATVGSASDGTPQNNVGYANVEVALAVDFDIALEATGPFTVLQPGAVTATIRNLGVLEAAGPVIVTIAQQAGGFPVVTGAGWTCVELNGTTTCTFPGPVAAGTTLPALTSNFGVTLGEHPVASLGATVSHPQDARPTNNTTVIAVDTKAVNLETVIVDLADGAPADIGDTRSFDIVVTNIGGLAPPGAATLTVAPGPGLIRGAFTGAGWACVPDGRNFTCSTTTAVPADGALPTLRFDAFVAGDAYPGTDVEVFVSVPGESVVDPSNGRRVYFEVIGAPDLVGSVAAPTSVTIGDLLSFEVGVRNIGVIDSDGPVTVDVALPGDASDAAGTGTDWECSVVDAGETLRCETSEVAPANGALATLTMSYRVAIGSYPRLSVAPIIDNAGDGDVSNTNPQPAVVGVIGIPDLRPRILGDQLIAGQTNLVTIDVENIGTEPADDTTIVTFDATSSDVGFTAVAGRGDGWACTAASTAPLACEHLGPVPAGGSLPLLTVDVDVDADRFDNGAPCVPMDYGDRLLRACTYTNLDIPYLHFDVDNAANVISPRVHVSADVGVRQTIDLAPSTSVTNLYPGSVATLTTTVQNLGVEEAPGPITLVQRVECGLAADLASAAQGSCLPGTDVIDVTVLDAAGAEWTCSVSDGVVTCSHPGPLAPGASLPAVIVNAEIGPDLYRANLWVAPSVRSPGDTNPRNDQPEGGRGITLRPQPDLAVSSWSSAYTVGVNATINAVVKNVSIDDIEGPTTATVDLGPSFQFIQAQGSDWSCAGSPLVTCTTNATIATGGGLALSLIVTPVDSGATQQPVRFTIDNAADTNDANDVKTVTHKIFLRPTPTAVLGVDRTVVKVNQDVNFDASFSENTFPDTEFRWDFGDRTTAFGRQSTHQYQRPGVYTAGLRVSNALRTAKDSARVIVVPDEPLVADAGDDRVAEEQLPIAFDATASRPFFAIESFTWDFGDGQTAVGRNVANIYTAPGIYTATLTIRSAGETAVDTVTVDVREQGAGTTGGLTVSVLDDAGRPIRAADVAVLDADGVRHSARTADDGVASLTNLPNGRYAVYGYKLGYLPAISRARVAGGLGTASVTLQPGAVGTATLEQRRLTLDEIIAAGIDINDPANRNVLEFQISLGFRVFTGGPSTAFPILLNGDLEIVDIPIDWVCDEARRSCEYDDPDVSISVEVDEIDGEPTLVFLIIPVKASWLKEFFEVTMVVANLASKGFAFTDGAATIDLPAGVSLAPTSDPQSLTFELADIPAGKTGTARWIVRGDQSGSYDLGAAYTGVLDPVGAPILLRAQTKEPLKVWGTDAVNVRVRAQQQVRKGKPYLVRLGIENVSDWPIYNLGLELGDLGGDASFEYAPWTSRTPTADQIDPLKTEWFDIWLIPGFDGELVTCNLCARQLTGALLAALTEPSFDTADLAGAFAGRAVGLPVNPDAAAVEIDSRPDDGLQFSAVRDGADDQLSWDPVAGATGYAIYELGTTTPLATVAGDVTASTLPAGAATYVLATLTDGDVPELRHPIAQPDTGGGGTTTTTTVPGGTTTTTIPGGTTTTTTPGDTTTTTTPGDTTTTTPGGGGTTSTTTPGGTTTTTTTPGGGGTTTTTTPGGTTTTTTPGGTTTTTTPGGTTTTTTTPGGGGTTSTTTPGGTTTTTTPSGTTTTTTTPAPPALPTISPAPLPPTPPAPPAAATPGLTGIPFLLRLGQLLNIQLPPGTQQFRVVLYSTPIELAAGGAATAVDVTIPTTLPLGSHTIVVWATVGSELQVLSQNVTVIGPQATDVLPSTGSSSSGFLIWALLLLTLGVCTVAATRRRSMLENTADRKRR